MKRLLNSAVAALVPVFCVGVTGFAALAVSGNLAASEEVPNDETTEVLAADDSEGLEVPAPGEAQPEPAEAAPAAEPTAEPQDTPTYKDTLQVEQDAEGNVVGITNYDGDTNSRAPLASVVFSQNGEVVASTAADAEGEFMIEGLAPGAYDVGASAEYGGYTYFVEVLPHTPASADTEDADENEVVPVSFEPEASAAETATPAAPGVLQLAVPGPGSSAAGEPGTIIDPLTTDGVPVGGFLPPGAGGGGYYGGGGGGFIGGAGGGGGVPAGGLGGLGTLLGAGAGIGTAALLDDDDDSQNSPSSP